MNEVEKALIFGLITFFLIYIIYYNFSLKKRFIEYNGKKIKKKSKKAKTKPLDFMEYTYLMTRFNLDQEKVNVLYCLRWIGIIDSFIISLTGTIIYYIPGHIMWKFLIGFVMVFALIYSLYEIFGRHLVKKGWSKK